MKNNKDFAKMLALLVIIVVSICAVLGAVFGFLNYRKTYSAKADTINQNAVFNGSPLLFNGFTTDMTWAESPLTNTTFKYGVTNYHDLEYWYADILRNDIELSFNLYYEGNNLVCSLGVSYYVSSDSAYAENLDFYIDDNAIMDSMPSDYYILESYTGNTFDYSTFNPLQYTFSKVYHLSDMYEVGVGQFAGFVIGDFDVSSVSGFNLWSYQDVEQEDFYNIVYCLQYFDSHNNSVLLCYYTAFFDGLADSPDEDVLFNLPYRRYFFISALDISGNLQYEIGYNDGWLDKGAEDWDNGYNQGYSAGDYYGYNRGVAEANRYSFLGLIGAVVDAPVQAFTGLLNFNILGFNMLSFFTGLLTLCLILWIVSKALGKK